MFKKVLSVLFAAALCLVAVAGTQANAATITMPKDCVWIYYDSQWDSYKLTAFNDAEGVAAGTICDDIGTIYALEITVKAASTPDTSVIINAESANWDQHDGMDWADNGDGTYTTVLKKDGPFSLFKTADTYAQICLGAWGAVDIEVVGAKWLDKDGGVIKAYGAGAAAGAALPKTGVVSAAVFYGIGSLLIGGGVVATKKARKEN